MFPCHMGHYNAVCDKSDNNLPARLCCAILGGVGSGKTGYTPLFWFGVSWFVCVCARKTFFLIFFICLTDNMFCCVFLLTT